MSLYDITVAAETSAHGVPLGLMYNLRVCKCQLMLLACVRGETSRDFNTQEEMAGTACDWFTAND